jgi:RNA polymerase sigma-70 factor (ECF subfamily)
MMPPPRNPEFPTTLWTQVVRAADPADAAARAALNALYQAYWFPLYAFIRRRGHDPEAALDLTQAYFARLLERRTLHAADAARGRFRSFLRADCARFLADHHEKTRALKRGGGTPPLSIDARDAEGRYLHQPAHDQTPEALFDRAWALSLLDSTLLALRDHYEKNGQAHTFDVLKITLTDSPRALPHAELARRLGISETAAQVATSRLRRRYRDLLRSALAATLDNPADADDELNTLFQALRG